MFRGEKVEDLRLALTILDDVQVTRSNMLEFSNLNENANNSQQPGYFHPQTPIQREWMSKHAYFRYKTNVATHLY